jgi:predicted nuclease of predicted toxin-antitoxin system
MRIVADESLDMPIVRALRAGGHEVLSVQESHPTSNDTAVLALANEQGAVLFTTDPDFGELVFRLGRAHHGVVLVRLEGLGEDTKQRLVLDAVAQHGQEMAGAFTVIAPGLVRIRPGR